VFEELSIIVSLHLITGQDKNLGKTMPPLMLPNKRRLVAQSCGHKTILNKCQNQNIIK